MSKPIPLRKKAGRKSKRPIKYEFELNYYQIGLSAEQMAKKYDVKPNTIYHWAMQFRNERGGKIKKDPAA